MEVAILILTAISTIAAVISAASAICARSEVLRLKNYINQNVNSHKSGDVSVENIGNNNGVISGVNSGEIKF